MIKRILYNKKITMSIPEYLAYEKGELSLKDIYYNQKLDNMAKAIINSKYKLFFIFLIASGLLLLNNVQAFAAVDTSKIDSAGFTLLTIVRTAGYWFCIVLACKDIIAALMEGNTKSVGQILVKYIVGFGALYALPWVFDLIKEILI